MSRNRQTTNHAAKSESNSDYSKPRGRKQTKTNDRPYERKGSADYYKANDPSWYMNNEFLKANMASFNWSNVAGLPLDLSEVPVLNNGSGLTNVKVSTKYYSSQYLPGGIMTARFIPCMDTASGIDAVNTQAQAIFTYVRKNNAAGTPYQPADLMLFFLALDSAYTFFAMVRRAWAYVMNYSMFNRYQPRAIVEQLGFDYDDIIDNKREYLDFINVMAEKLNVLAVPNDATVFARHVWLVSNVWLDEPGIMSSVYAYVPEGFYRYDHTAGFTGGQLVYEQWVDKREGYTWNDPMTAHHLLGEIKAYWNRMFEPLFHDQDVAIMSGDILRAYGMRIMQLAPTTMEYSIAPQFSQEVLDQLHNTRFLGTPLNEYSPRALSKTLDIKQNLGTLSFEPWFYVTSQASFENAKVFIDTSKDEVTPADNLVLTRNTPTIGEAQCYYKSGVPSSTGITLYDGNWDSETFAFHTISRVASCGTELFTYCEVRSVHFDTNTGYYDPLSGPEAVSIYAAPAMDLQFTTVSRPYVAATYPELTTGFNYRPIWYKPTYSKASANTSGYAIFPWSGYVVDSDVHRFTTVDFRTIARINDAVMYSMFDVAKYDKLG